MENIDMQRRSSKIKRKHKKDMSRMGDSFEKIEHHVQSKNTTGCTNIIESSVENSSIVKTKPLKRKKKKSLINQKDGSSCDLKRRKESLFEENESPKRTKYNKVGQDEGQTNLIKKEKHVKTNIINFNNEEYKPGMLSNILQLKKYGHLILPWDPTFGLDPMYNKKHKHPKSGTEETVEKPSLKINPLFDLSKISEDNATLSSDSSESKLFVGNLPSSTKMIDLKKLFRKFGLVVKIKLRADELNTKKFNGKKKKSYKNNHCLNAIITFKSSKSCEDALKMNGVLYEGHHLRVTLAKEEVKSEPDKSVFVGNLAFKAQDEDLWRAFESCGPIDSVRVVRDKRSGKGKGFGYVNFKSAHSAEKAVTLNGTFLLDREIRVSRIDHLARSQSNIVTIKRKHRKIKSSAGKMSAGEKKKNKLNNMEIASEESDNRQVHESDKIHLSSNKKVKQKKLKKKNLEM